MVDVNIYIYKRKKLEVTSGSTKKTSICQLLPRPVFQSFIYTYVVYMTASERCAKMIAWLYGSLLFFQVKNSDINIYLCVVTNRLCPEYSQI